MGAFWLHVDYHDMWGGRRDLHLVFAYGEPILVERVTKK